MKKNTQIVTVVATAIGAALFVIIGYFINIPTPIPNTNIQLQYAVQALFAAIFGPVAGFFIGFLGHALKDSLMYGSPWWSWVLSSGLFGLIIGAFRKLINLESGKFSGKQVLLFNVVQIVSNLLVWGIIAPIGDVLIYSEPANKVFTQGVVAGLANSVTVAIAGTILLGIYAKTRTQKGSLTVEK